jgi:carbamoylphosphate synthase large subunit
MIAVDIAGNKHATKTLLGDMGVPVPKGYRIREEEEFEATLERVGFPASSNRSTEITVKERRSVSTI